jgi:hypothetical protein
MASQKMVEARRSRRDTGDAKQRAPARTRRTKTPRQPPPIKAELPEPRSTFVF